MRLRRSGDERAAVQVQQHGRVARRHTGPLDPLAAHLPVLVPCAHCFDEGRRVGTEPGAAELKLEQPTSPEHLRVREDAALANAVGVELDRAKDVAPRRLLQASANIRRCAHATEATARYVAFMPNLTLLIVHHTASPATQELLEAALAGTRAEGVEGVHGAVRPAPA